MDESGKTCLIFTNSPRIMLLIVISPENTVPFEHEIVRALFNEGLRFFHLRKPAFTKDDTKAYIKELPVEYLNRTSLHYHHSLAEEYSLGGIHYPAANIKDVDRTTHTNILRTSFSAHSFQELSSVNKSVSYAFISPVFNSISKQGYSANPELKRLKDYKLSHHLHTPIIALGGITEQDVETAREMGFSGVAVLGSIWQFADGKQSVKEIVSKFRALQTACNQ